MKRLIVFVCLLVSVVVIGTRNIGAREPDTDPNPFAPRGEADPFDKRRVLIESAEGVLQGKQVKFKLGVPDGSREAIHQATEKLRDAGSDAEREKAQGELRRLLAEYFDKDMKRRKTELDEMEKRLSKLRDQLARRHSKMDEIVDLQIKVLINEADGMGFFSGEPQSDLKLASPLERMKKDQRYFYSPRTVEAVIVPGSPPPPVPTAPPATSAAPTAPPVPGQPAPTPTPAPSAFPGAEE
jgi:hypothetical protein